MLWSTQRQCSLKPFLFLLLDKGVQARNCGVEVPTLPSGKAKERSEKKWGRESGGRLRAAYHVAALGEAEEERLSSKTIWGLRSYKNGGQIYFKSNKLTNSVIPDDFLQPLAFLS